MARALLMMIANANQIGKYNLLNLNGVFVGIIRNASIDDIFFTFQKFCQDCCFSDVAH